MKFSVTVPVAIVFSVLLVCVFGSSLFLIHTGKAPASLLFVPVSAFLTGAVTYAVGLMQTPSGMKLVPLSSEESHEPKAPTPPHPPVAS